MDKLARFANEEELRKVLEEDFRVQAEIASFIKSEGIEPSKELMEIAAAYPPEFVDRLMEVEDKLSDLFFGLTYEIISNKTLRRDRSPEALMEALAIGEKYFSKAKAIHEQADCYGFLKLILETNASLFDYEDHLFGCIGIKRDRSGISLPQKNAIAVQSAAQVLWHLGKIKIPKIEAMRGVLLDERYVFYRLFALNRFKPRTIDNWIRLVCPIPQTERRVYGVLNEDTFNNLVLIPGIFTEVGINFQKLRFAAVCLTKVLKTLGWGIDQILNSKYILLLRGPLGYQLHSCACGWVREAFSEDGSIFPL